MIIERKLEKLIDRVYDGEQIAKDELKYLLSFDESSFESAIIRAAASDIVRSRNDNSAVILGQIGVDVFPCPGGCRFCTFGEDHTEFENQRMHEEELEKKVIEFCSQEDLYALYLMTMHTYDIDFYLETVRKVRRMIPKETQIWANVGDSDIEVFREMKKTGINGVYHVCRLGEGKDTKLNPKERKRTMKNALDAGLELYTCCEPIGPEHTLDEIADNVFIGIEMEIYQHAAMRRVAVPGSPMFKYGQISELRLAHIVGGIALATVNLPTMQYMGVHETNSLSYLAGANIATAESGANPRDNVGDTSGHRGMDMRRCRKMLYECGFTNLRRGDESKIPLDFDYLVKTDSLD